jgi:hypothetical protein
MVLKTEGSRPITPPPGRAGDHLGVSEKQTGPSGREGFLLVTMSDPETRSSAHLSGLVDGHTEPCLSPYIRINVC